MADTTVTYVVGVISLPEASGGTAAGFNLDELDSGEGSSAADANCEEFNEDFVNVHESSHTGVDNALQGLVPTIESLLPAENCPGMVQAGCLDATLQQQILEGSLILMVEVQGVNDFTFDDSVQLQLVLGSVPDGATLMEGAGGGLAAGQTFDTMQVLGNPVEGDIFQGRLRARTDLLTLQINAGDFMLPLMIRDAEVRFNITADTLARGGIGGSLRTDDIVAAAAAVMPDLADTVRTVVENIADIEPSSADPLVCQSVSVGLTFDAVGATRNP